MGNDYQDDLILLRDLVFALLCKHVLLNESIADEEGVNAGMRNAVCHGAFITEVHQAIAEGYVLYQALRGNGKSRDG